MGVTYHGRAGAVQDHVDHPEKVKSWFDFRSLFEVDVVEESQEPEKSWGPQRIDLFNNWRGW